MPTFLIVGAAKAGTTAVYHYLDEHPQVFMSPTKEPHYFAFAGRAPGFRGPGDLDDRDVITTEGAYRRLFAQGETFPARGEASVTSLYFPDAAEGIRSLVPAAKIIIMLRQPWERAVSNYLNLVRDGRESLSFEESLAREPQRIEDHWDHMWRYRDLGLYYEQVRRFANRFPPEQMRICLYEELRRDAVGFMQSLYRFIGVDDTFRPRVEIRHNEAGVPRNVFVSRLMNTRHDLWFRVRDRLPSYVRRPVRTLQRYVNRRNLVRPTEFASDETRCAFMESIRADIERLHEYAPVDHWLHS